MSSKTIPIQIVITNKELVYKNSDDQ